MISPRIMLMKKVVFVKKDRWLEGGKKGKQYSQNQKKSMFPFQIYVIHNYLFMLYILIETIRKNMVK